MRIGYARVSTQDQNLSRQQDQLREDGCTRIFEEKLSGAKHDRPELDRMLDTLREGDIVVVTELSRLSRSVRDLFDIVGKMVRSEHRFAQSKSRGLTRQHRRDASFSPSSPASANSKEN